ncbi:hypothetical protein [Nocardioides salsibiostraticola]
MTSTVRCRPALSRLARALEVDVSELVGLDDVPDADLRALYDQVNHALYGQGKQAYARVANLTRTMPSPLAAKLAEKFLPPFLGARVAEQLPSAKARDLVSRISLDYLADLAIALDPVGARPVIHEIPAERIGEVARVLFDRGEYEAMAEFARAVTPDALLAVLDQASSADLVEVLPLLEWGPALDEVLPRLSPEKVDGLVAGLSAAQLADLAIAMDLQPLQPILEGLSDEAVSGAVRELFARGEYVAVAGLAGAVPPRLINVAVEVASPRDVEAMLPLLQDSPGLESVLASLSATNQ